MATLDILEELNTDMSCLAAVGDALNFASECNLGCSGEQCERLALLMYRLLESVSEKLVALHKQEG